MAGAPDTSTARPARGRRVRRATGDDRERAILETAERLLGERSLHEISIDDLARGAGISRPTFYFYFPSKSAVLLTLFDRMIAEAQGRRDEAVAPLDQDPVAYCREAITAFFETFGAHRAVTVAAAEARIADAEVRALWSQVMEVWVRDAVEVIEFERGRGAAPEGLPARELAIALIQMNERVLHSTFAGEEPCVSEEHAVEVLSSIWLNAIYGAVSA